MKNKIKRIFAFLITILMMVNVIPASAPAENTGESGQISLPFIRDNLKYAIEGSNAIVVGLDSNASSTMFTIPATVTYNEAVYPVTAIREDAFRGISGYNITVLSDNITLRGSHTNDSDYHGAFAEAKNSTILFAGKNVTFGTAAFMYSSGMTVKTLYADQGGSVALGQKAFAFCGNLNLQVGPGQSVSGSDYNVFQSSSGTLSFLGGVKSIGGYSFYDSSISRITTTPADSYNWYDGGLNYKLDLILKAKMGYQVYWGRWDIVRSMTVDYDDPAILLNQSAFGSFGNGTAPVTVNFHAGVGTIKADTFKTFNGGAGSVINIYGDSATVEAGAFPDSANLTVNFDMYKSAVTGAELLDSLENTAVNYRMTTETYHDDLFEYTLYKDENGNVKTAEINGIYEGFTGDTIEFSSTTRDENQYPVTGFRSAALKQNSTVTRIIFNNEKAFTTGTYAFDGMSALTSVVLKGAGKVQFGKRAFNNCTALASVTGENGAVSGSASFDDGETFAGCSALGTVRIGQIDKIGINTFLNLNALKTFEANSINNIQPWGFNQCQALETIQVNGGVSVLNSYAFNQCNTLQSVQINGNVPTISGGAFEKCQSLETVQISGNVDTIAGYAFEYCNALKTIRIDGNVGTIETYAFMSCKALNTLYIGGNVNEIQGYAFSGCSAMEKLIILGKTNKMGYGALVSNAMRVAVFKGGIGTFEAYAIYGSKAFTQENNLIYVGSVGGSGSLNSYAFGYNGKAYLNVTYSQLSNALTGWDLYVDDYSYSNQSQGADIYVREGGSNGDGSASSPWNTVRGALYSMYWNSLYRDNFQKDCAAAGADDLGLVFYGDMKKDVEAFTLHILPAQSTAEASFPAASWNSVKEYYNFSNLPATYTYLESVVFEGNCEKITISDGAFSEFPNLKTVEVRNPDAEVMIGKNAFANTKVNTICTAQQTVTSNAGKVTLAKGTNAPIGTALVMTGGTEDQRSAILSAAWNEGLFAGVDDVDIMIRYFDLSLKSPAGATVNKPAHVSITQKSVVFSGVDTIAPREFALFHLDDGAPSLATAAFTLDETDNTISYTFDADGFSPYAAAYVIDSETLSDGIYTYVVDKNNKATIIGYDTGFTGSELNIPAETTINGVTYPVIGIADSALINPPTGITITSVCFNNTASVLVGNNAFAGLTSVESIHFNGSGNVVFKDETAFNGSGTATAAVSMPFGFTAQTENGEYGTVFSGLAGGYELTVDQVTSIPANAFKNDTRLTKVTVLSALVNPEKFNASWSNPYRRDFANCAVGTSAFEGATSLTGFAVEKSSGESIAIGNEAFKDCSSLTTLSIPDPLCGIGEHGLSNTGFTSLTLQVEDLGLGKEALAYCANLKAVEFIGDIYNGGTDFLGGSGDHATMPEQLVFNGNVEFQLHSQSVRSERLKVLVFKNGGVNSIWEDVFYTEGPSQASNLTVYVDGKNYDDPSIDDEAFPADQTVRIYMNLPILREEAGQSYWLKKSKNVVDLAYSKDEAPTDLYVDASVSDYTIQTGTVGAPFNSLAKAMEAANADYDNATRFRRYFAEAGYDCSDLYFAEGNYMVTEFTLHVVGETPEIDNTFAGDKRLIGVEINVDGDIQVDDNAFKGCTNLKSLQVEKVSGNLTAGTKAFSGCAKLEGLTVKQAGNLDIGSSCFEECSALTEFTIRSAGNVTIRDNAFEDCTGIKAINIQHADNVGIKANAFKGTAVKTADIQVSGNVTFEADAFKGLATLSTLTVNGTKGVSDLSIAAGAFANCGTLDSIQLTNTKAPVILKDAFTGTAVGVLRIDGGASGIQAGAFDNSQTLTTYIDGSTTFTEPLANKIGSFCNIILTQPAVISTDAQVFSGNPALERVYLGKDTGKEQTGGEIFTGMPQDAAAYVALKRDAFTDACRPVRTDGILRFLDDVDYLYIDGTNTNEHPDGSVNNGFRTFAQAKEYADSLGQAGTASNDEYYYTDIAEVIRAAYGISDISYNEKEIRFSIPQTETNAVTFLVKGVVTVSEDETWDSGDGRNITLLRSEEFTVQPIVNLTGGTLTLGKVVLDGNGLVSAKPLIESNKTKTTIVIHDGAQLRNNNNAACGAWDGSEYVGGGAIRTIGNITMDGGLISGNKACYGGGVHLSCGTFNMSGGCIENNTAYLAAPTQNVSYSCGGGVLLTRNAVMNLSGGTVSGNYADYGSGAGISLGSLYAVNGSNAAILNMTGGSISGNLSRFEGGGLYIQMGSKAVISAGSITSNTCQGGVGSTNYGGGGIYINGSHNIYKFPDGELHLGDVLITDNSADLSGGGIAGCGTSTTRIYLTNGTAIYDNPAGDNADIHLDNVSYWAYYGWSEASLEATISPFMFNGTRYNWIDAETGEVFTEAELSALRSRTVHLRANPDEGAPTTGSVIISGNTSASRGGGIGSNGTIIMGEKPRQSTITVTPEASKIVVNNDMEEGQKFTFSTYLEKYQDTTKLVYSDRIDYYHVFDKEELLGSTAYVTGAREDQKQVIIGLPSYSFEAMEDDIGRIVTLLVTEDTPTNGVTISDEKTYLEFQYVVGLEASGELTAYLKQVSKGTYRRNADGTPDFNADVKEYSYKKVKYYHRNTVPVSLDNAAFINRMKYRDITADKTWLNADGSTTPPQGAKITLELYADGKATGKTVTLDGTPDANGEDKAWKAIWKDQEIYRKDSSGFPYKENETDEDYVRIRYSVREVSRSPEHYQPDSDEVSVVPGTDTVITNKERLGSLKLRKTWKGVPQDYDVSGLSITITDPDGTERVITYADLDANGEYLIAENVPEGRLYRVRETNAETLIAGYTLVTGESRTEGSGTTAYGQVNVIELINVYKASNVRPTDISVSIRKQWDDRDNLDGSRPESLLVTLLADGQEKQTVTLSDENEWTAQVTGLPKYNTEGKTIAYTWREETIPGYMASMRTEGNETTIINTHIPEVTSVSVRKVWDDDHDAAGKRPLQIIMRLSNGMTVTLNEQNAWNATIDNLPVTYEGKPIAYSWTEQRVIGYTNTDITVKGNLTVFTNQYTKLPDKPYLGRTPKVVSEPVEEITEYDTPLGGEVLINHVGDCFD